MENRKHVPFTTEGIRRGIVQAYPLFFASLTYGVAFGLLAREVGLSVLEALLMSAAVYSGSAQIAALTIMDNADPWTSASAVALAATIFVVNARYVLYGATLRPWLGGVRAWQAYGALSILADGNWILSSRAREGGEADAGHVFGSGLVMFVGWLVGTLLGALLGRLIADPEALGLDFLLVTFCAAALVPAYEGGRTLLLLAVAGGMALLASLVVGGGWPIIAAGIAGASIAALRADGDQADSIVDERA